MKKLKKKPARKPASRKAKKITKKVKKKVKKPLRSPKMTWLQPSTESNREGTQWDVWRNKEKDYVIVRNHKDGKPAEFGSGFRKTVIDNHHRHLAYAVKACEQHLALRLGVEYDEIRTNHEEILHRSLKWLGPFKEESEMSKWHTWYTQCGRYRVVRASPRFEGGDWYFAASHGKSDVISRDYKTLNDAIRACEKVHCRETGQDPEHFTTNRTDIVPLAAKAKLHDLPTIDTIPEDGAVPAIAPTKAAVEPTGKRGGRASGSGTIAARATAVLTSSKWLSMGDLCTALDTSTTFYNVMKKLVESGVAERNEKGLWRLSRTKE